MIPAILTIAVLTLGWALARNAWRGSDPHDDARDLALRMLRMGWKPLTVRARVTGVSSGSAPSGGPASAPTEGEK